MTITLSSLIFALLIFGIAWFGRRKLGYSHFRHTISELGEYGSPLSKTVSWGFFAPVGLGLFVIAFLTYLRPGQGELSTALVVLATALGVGYFGAAIFPCDAGSPLNGTWRQGVHNLVGGVEYVGGALGLFLAAQAVTNPVLTTVFQAGSGIVALAAVLLSVPQVSAGRGLVQWIGEFVLFAGLILLSYLMR